MSKDKQNKKSEKKRENGRVLHKTTKIHNYLKLRKENKKHIEDMDKSKTDGSLNGLKKKVLMLSVRIILLLN